VPCRAVVGMFFLFEAAVMKVPATEEESISESETEREKLRVRERKTRFQRVFLSKFEFVPSPFGFVYQICVYYCAPRVQYEFNPYWVRADLRRRAAQFIVLKL